jgi:hypothetical protein
VRLSLRDAAWIDMRDLAQTTNESHPVAQPRDHAARTCDHIDWISALQRAFGAGVCATIP